jgi:hypothetical protein
MKVVCSENKTHVNQWLWLTSPVSLREIETKEKVPTLICDPTMIFLLIILNNPNRLHRLTYQTIVNSYFNLVYIQSIIKEMMINYKNESPTDNNNANEFSNIDDYKVFIMKKLSTQFFKKYDGKYEKCLVKNL